LDLEIPLGTVAALTGAGAMSLAFDGIVVEGQRRMMMLLPAMSQAQAPENKGLGIESMPPSVGIRRDEAAWPWGHKVGDVLGLSNLLAKSFGYEVSDRCELCTGQGRRASVDVSRIVDPTKSLASGAILPWTTINSQYYLGLLETLAARTGLDLQVPWNALGQAMQDLVLHGDAESTFKGVVHDVEKRIAKTATGRGQVPLPSLFSSLQFTPCDACQGTGLGMDALTSRHGTMGIASLWNASLQDVPALLTRLNPVEDESWSLQAAVRRAELGADLGLSKVLLSQPTESLSLAERYTLRLAEGLGCSLNGLLFVIESPSAQMKETSMDALVACMRRRAQAGDSFLLVEQSPRVLASLDSVIDIPA